MHRDALTYVDLYCVSCRTFEGEVTQHKLVPVPGETEGEYIITGWLECSHCERRYDIRDGVPVLAQGAPYALHELPHADDLASQYLDAHYGTINAGYWRRMSEARGKGLCLDVGCSVGRYTFECVNTGFAVGLDLNLGQLRLAAELQRAGKINYRRKARAMGYEEAVASVVPSTNVLFILADIHDPPFKMETFDFIGALNLIDSVKRPLTALGQMDAMLKRGGRLFLSTPYAWNADISEEWLETEELDPHSFIKSLLTGEQVPECEFSYRIAEARINIPWRLRKQDSQQFVYFADAIAAEKLR